METTVDELPDAASIHANSEVALGDAQSLSYMQRAINRLPDKQRLAILLSTHDEQSNADIAQILDTSEGAVEQLLVRARRSLRETYRELV